MKTIILLSLLILALSGCGKIYDVRGFESYVKNFETEASSRNVTLNTSTLKIVFSDPSDPGKAGECVSVPSATFNLVATFYIIPTVNIRKSTWDTTSEAEHEALIFHELGHCLLSAVHDSRFGIGCPLSLMYPDKMPIDCYIGFRKEYLDHLFQ